MKPLALVVLALLFASCAVGPAVSKSSMGNVEIQVIPPEGMDVRRAEVYVDGLFIGHATDDLPVLELRNGERRIRCEMTGCSRWEKTVSILGDPNHQVINIFLEKATTPGAKEASSVR